MHELTPFNTADTLNGQLIAQQREKGQTGTMTDRRQQEKTIRAVIGAAGQRQQVGQRRCGDFAARSVRDTGGEYNQCVGKASAMLTWSSTNATLGYAASDGWSGSRPVSGAESTGPLSSTTTFTLTCNGPGGSDSASATVTVASAGTTYGLEWPGDGAVRRMLYWHNPFPIYDATYIFRVYPRKKPVPPFPNGYYTTFFWGNDGTFTWYNGGANTYYGAHPYPIPAPNGPGQWEISVYSNDYVTGMKIEDAGEYWGIRAFRGLGRTFWFTHRYVPGGEKLLYR